MKIINTTDDKPFIEFKIDKRGKVKFSATSIWWGGINRGFVCSDGTEGNTCKPKELKKYMKAFRNRKIKSMEKEILALQKKLELFKIQTKDFDY